MTFTALLSGVLVLFGSLLSPARHPVEMIEVPPGGPVTLDGTISDEEWRGAFRQEMAGGGEVRLLRHGAHLYVGVRGTKAGWGHVYVADGDAVSVLHASAALGAAIYRKDEKGAWNPSQGFTWALRDTSMSAEAVSARERYFEAHGWVATTNGMGEPSEIEFRVGGQFVKGGTVRIAVVYAAGDDETLGYWPRTLEDGTRAKQLVFGETPPALAFDRATWAVLEL